MVHFDYCSNKYRNFQSDSDVVSLICGALESIHAALAIMAYNDMPKQLYNEEVHASDQFCVTFSIYLLQYFIELHSLVSLCRLIAS